MNQDGVRKLKKYTIPEGLSTPYTSTLNALWVE